MLEIKEIPVAMIKVGAHDQRHGFDEETLAGLSSSIPRVGLLYPILVKKEGEGYLVIDGHTRLEAFKRMGRETITCTVAGVEVAKNTEISFAGNFFRKELTPVELSAAIKDALETGAMTMEQIADGFHRTVNWVKSMIAICDWPPDVQMAMHQTGLSTAAAYNLSQITDDVYRGFLLQNAVEGGVTARTTAGWLQAWRSAVIMTEAVQAEPVDGRPPQQPIIPQSPCFLCHNVFLVNEMSHVPMCGSCIRTIVTST